MEYVQRLWRKLSWAELHGLIWWSHGFLYECWAHRPINKSFRSGNRRRSHFSQASVSGKSHPGWQRPIERFRRHEHEGYLGYNCIQEAVIWATISGSKSAGRNLKWSFWAHSARWDYYGSQYEVKQTRILRSLRCGLDFLLRWKGKNLRLANEEKVLALMGLLTLRLVDSAFLGLRYCAWFPCWAQQILAA